MTDQESREIDWPTRRWLKWGALAVVVLAVIVGFFIWLGNQSSEGEPPPPPVGEQFEWSIVLTDQTGDTVTLKGDEPLGFPTETWQNDFQVARSVGNTFEWDVDAELPAPVVEIDGAADCAALNTLLAHWIAEIGSAQGDAHTWESRAFAQHVVDTMRTTGCELDETALAGL